MTNSPAVREIAIDFDGTAWSLLNSLGQLAGIPKWQGEVLTHENCSTWDTVVEIWGPDVDVAFAFEKMAEARDVSRLRQFGLFDGFARAINVFEANGFKPTILSHNSDTCIAGITEYLSEQGINAPVISAKPKEKIEWCLERQAALVDDAPETILMAHEAGVPLTSLRFLYNAEAIDQTQTPWGRDWSELLPLTLMTLGVKNPVV
jgi:hypothetical protein